MPQGVIKKLVDRGFGFIKGVKGEIFFHQSALEGTTFEALSEGQQVEYEEGTGPNGINISVSHLVFSSFFSCRRGLFMSGYS
ncbi:MAG: cold shock domain-containing protein, partial [Planctomycetes bacterium]|nr:cold shock domain-containing protein [Planctomycetota bacterium]